MSVLIRNNVRVVGDAPTAMVFAHGYGCDQNMWRQLTPVFKDHYRLVLFDHVGAGRSDLGAYNRQKYDRLDGYAQDLIEICDALSLRQAVFVGHSVSTMIGVLAAVRRPELFSKLVLVAPSPRYINDGDYIGGFSHEDIVGLLDFLDTNHLGWSSAMAPVVMGNPDRPELGEELANSFCRTDPEIAKHFARVTFTSDNRADLAKLTVPSLILQCDQDAIAPLGVGDYLHRHLRDSALVRLVATGHCPHMSAPAETAARMAEFLQIQTPPQQGTAAAAA